MAGRHGDTFLDVVLGGDFGLARQDYAPGDALSITARTVVTSRFDTGSPSFNQLNTDYLGGLAVGRQFGDDAWEVWVYHQSSHLGDETLDLGIRRRIDYAREAVRLLWSHDFGPLRLYGGPTYNVTGERFLRRRTTLQLGSEYRFEYWGRPMYVAADLQSRSEVDFRPSLATQWGMELGDPAKVRNRPRLFLEFYTGYSNMGQFWNAYENSAMVGVGYNW